MAPMRGFQHPVGPESPHTYWVRRGVLVAVLVLIIVLLVWLLSTLLGSNTNETTAVPAAPSSTQTSVSVNPSWTDTAWGPTPSASSPSSSVSGSASATPSPSGSASATPSASSAFATPTPAKAQTSSKVQTGACSASTTTVSLSAASGSVKVGSKVAFTVGLANTSKTDCQWDFAKLPVHVSVTSGSDNIWSSGDCAAWSPRGVAKVPAGKTYSFGVTWPTQRSTAKSCTLSTGQLGAGYYVATAQTGDTVSKKFVMQLHQ